MRRLEHAEDGSFWDYFHRSHGFWDFFHPFSPYIWVTLALLLLLQCAVGVLVAKAESTLLRFEVKPLDVCDS